ncbi:MULTISPECIES: RDD family protein [Prauserella salsuginis group]|uniref:RDD family protein n=1 Tax=Prauserella salsuginis TaxID=387889 RepID=A0ABW6G3N4_9PSEU|nr:MULTISPECIES: RDD family protein [Prauserella salsuginis group]
MELGPLLHRFLARLLDLLIVGAVAGAVLVPLAIIFGRDHGFLGTGEMLRGGYAVLLPLVLMVYEAIGLAKRGRTVGKKIMGLRVVTRSSSTTGAGLVAGPAIGRAFLTSGLGVLNILLYVGSLLLLLFWLSPVFDTLGRRGWHDAHAKTYVISTKPTY